MKPSNTGASIAENHGFESDETSPNPIANQCTISPVTNAVCTNSRIYSP